MTIQSQGPRTRLTLVTRALIGATATIALISAFLAVKIVLDFSEAARLSKDNRAQEADLNKNAVTLAKAKQLTHQDLPKGLDAVGALQGALQESAQKHMCEVSEFKTDTDAIPYLSHYSKDTTAKGWIQMEARVVLQGRLRDLFDVLRSLRDANVPVEIDSIDLTRTSIDANGESVISAQVLIQALSRGSA